MQLDKYQEQALQSNVRLIEAGPGAGKTRTIVERFIAQAKKKLNLELHLYHLPMLRPMKRENVVRHIC